MMAPRARPSVTADHRRLEQLVLMRFPDETPLEDIIKHIKDATKSPEMPRGHSHLYRPDRLSEADKTLTSPVHNRPEGIPLRRTLQLALAQLDLVYFVEDGIIYITSRTRPRTTPSAGACHRPRRLPKSSTKRPAANSLWTNEKPDRDSQSQERSRRFGSRREPGLGRRRTRPADRNRSSESRTKSTSKP